MKLSTICIKNFRRLKNVQISIDKDKTIFVGSNNSGKTSATQALQIFLNASRDRFTIHDFNSQCWKQFIETTSKKQTAADHILSYPTIILDLWFEIEESDLHRVLDLLPGLNWKDQPIGIRLEYKPKNPEELYSHFQENFLKAKNAKEKNAPDSKFHPWPLDLRDYLSKHLNDEYEVCYYILDRTNFDEKLEQKEDFQQQILGSKDKSGQKILSTLLRVDFLNAQRHLSDTSSTGRADEGGGRSENLSKRLTKFYKKNLQKHEDDFNAIKTLSESEDHLSDHFSTVFKPTLDNLNKLNYPGFKDPHLIIKAVLNPENIMAQNAELHYVLDSNDATKPALPDKYNGLGFKNLIYMVIELMDFQTQWLDEQTPSLLHLIVIEEPEAHLHSQLQQVFINKVLEILRDNIPQKSILSNQLIITTHSPHIIYESGFTPIRYFRRVKENLEQTSDVLNLSEFKGPNDNFLQQYMKLTHCDLFFADAAILVEGNVERLLLPLMIEQVAPELKSKYLSILEVGGAFAYRFKELINFIGCTALVITDLDSVHPKDEKEASKEDKTDENEDEIIEETEKGTCRTDVVNAVTSNQTLIQWLPGVKSVSELLNLEDNKKVQIKSANTPALVRVCYQTFQEITWGEEKIKFAGRTLEESFAHKNLLWCQEKERKHLGLKVKNSSKAITFDEILEKTFNRVKGTYFNKTNFALGLITEDKKNWATPDYIKEGLQWLDSQLSQKSSMTK